MPNIIQTVSQLIENQFPQVYREEGPQLIAFVKAYFEFLEQDEESSLKLNRQLFDINDIDETLNRFVVEYKEKYLAEFPFVSATDKRFMIKNIIDYYRSKGSKQALELLMAMLYGEQAEVYYPGQDVLRVSDSDWFRPYYLELSRSSRTKTFVDKQIRGSRSNARAFVEAVVTKRVDGKLIDLVYLSDVRGTFRRGDKISDDGNNRKAPTVLGSLTAIEIELGGRDNVIGDVFDVISNGAKQGKVRVTEVQDATGRVDFQLLNGGSGYSVENANGVQYTDIYVSDVVLDVNNPRLDFIRFEKIEQPMERIYALSSSDIVENAQLYDYLAGYQSAPAGGAYVANGIITAIANTYANGELIPSGTQALGIDANANTFTIGETVTSGSKSGSVVSASGVELIITVNTDPFLNGDTITGALSSATANVESSVPGVRMDVLVTDQTFANQILIVTTTVQDGDFADTEVVDEEASVKITFENDVRFNVDDEIIQYVKANTNFNIVETFSANGTQNTFTHSANLEATGITSVTVTIDNDLRIENTNYTITNENVQFYANSIPADGTTVLISATQSIEKIIDAAVGHLGTTGRLSMLNTAVFNVGDVIQSSGGAVTANVTSISDGSLFFEGADGMFLINETVEVVGDSASNSTVQSVTYDVDDVFGTFIEDAVIDQDVIGSVATGRIAAGGVEVVVAGARGIVQKDGTLAADEIVVKDIFGTFTAGKKIRGRRTRKVETINSFTTTGAYSLRLNGNTNANGTVDIVSNNYVVGTLVGQNTSAIGVKYDGNTTFTATDTGDLFINTRRELLISPPIFSVDDKTYNIDITREYFPDILIDNFTDAERGTKALFDAFVQFPTAASDAVLFEVGGSGTGMWLGLREDPSSPGDYVFRYRAGDGGANGDILTTAGAGIAVIDIPETSLPQDANYHHVVWYADPDTGFIQLWIDGTSMGTSTATDNTLEGGLWAGSNIGKYGASAGTIVANEPTGDWKADLGSTLRYYYNETANTTSVAGTIVDLNYEPIYGKSLGSSATFDIESIDNVDTYTLNTDFPYANNVADIQYLDIKISGEGSGVGFVDSFTINDGGTNYSVGGGITITNGGYAQGNPLINASAVISGVDANGSIIEITVTERGEGYYGVPQISLPSTTGDAANVEINMDFGYGFPKAPDGDKDNLIQDLLTLEDFTIGNIVSLGSINPGAGYNRDPFVVVHNKYIASYRRGNFYIEVSNVSGSFRPGELLTQTVNSEQFSKGKVISYDFNTRTLSVERTSFEVGFDPLLPITGARSGASATIVNIFPIEDQNIMGDNAVVSADVIAANGVATAVEVIDSGYGYIQDGIVSLESANTPFIITGKSKATQQGIGEGYWRTTSSHLNSEKKIHDNKYYHEFSYDVLSGLALNKYENVIKRVLHIAGTELFGSVVKRSNVPLTVSTPSGNSSISAE